MVRLIDLTYFSHETIQDPLQVLAIHEPAIAFGSFSTSKLVFVKHMDFEGSIEKDAASFVFFRSRNGFWRIPWPTHRYIKRNKPNVVLVQGFIFPLQLILLKLQLKRDTKIIVQHHGEQPFTGVKGLIQKIAARYTDAWLFTSSGNARIWINKKIIPQNGLCFELPEASTTFKRSADKNAIKAKLDMTGDQNFLWVGRLNENKDPLTVIQGFGCFIKRHTEAILFMIFHEDDLIGEVNKLVCKLGIKNQVRLIGALPHKELEQWYNAADFYISGSWQEGSGYALIEAIACGCILVVTDIPPFRKLTDGKLAFLYPPGQPAALLQQLEDAININRKQRSDSLVDYFNKNLSFQFIARELDCICKKCLEKTD